MSFADQLSLDLRLSAAQATAGQVSLERVAATVRVKAGLASFDISDATAFSGNIQAGFRVERKDGGRFGEVRFLAEHIDGAAFLGALGEARLVPEARGTISAILKGPVSDWQSLPETASGTVSVRFGAGRMSGFDLAAFVDRVAKGGFFSLAEVSKGAVNFENAELKAQISNGVARLDKAEAVTPQGTVVLTGIVPYIGRSLALSGRLSTGGDDAKPANVFFVGGSWGNPFISPVYAPALPN